MIGIIGCEAIFITEVPKTSIMSSLNPCKMGIKYDHTLETPHFALTSELWGVVYFDCFKNNAQ